MYPDSSAKTIHRCIPYMLYQFFLAYRSALIKKQIFQNSTFFSGQRHPLFFCICLALFCIEPYVPIVQANISLYKFTSCQASDPRLKFLQMKWFFHVIIGSCIQPFHFIRYLASRRQNQHLCLLILPPEFP